MKDTVSNHSYFVTIYAHMIGRVIKWAGPRDYLMFAALCHDVAETVTGDLVSPTKPHILDYEKHDAYVDRHMYDRMGGIVIELADMSDSLSTSTMDEADAIIKTADRLDALLFLIMEERRGNKVISDLVKDAFNRFERAWRDLPAPKDLLDMTFQTMMVPSIEAHKHEGGRGI